MLNIQISEKDLNEYFIKDLCEKNNKEVPSIIWQHETQRVVGGRRKDFHDVNIALFWYKQKTIVKAFYICNGETNIGIVCIDKLMYYFLLKTNPIFIIWVS